MDSLTQAALGASVAETLVGKKIGRAASVIGAVAGTIPDLDIIFYPLLNDLQKISFHRGYSHSFIFCLAAPILLTLIFKYFGKTRMLKYREAYLCLVFVFVTHVILDTFTAYGTLLFLPFSDSRISLDLIGIIDPFYSLPLLLGLVILFLLNYFKKSDSLRPVYLGLIVSSLYLSSTPFTKSLADTHIKEQMQRINISTQKYSSIPVYAGNLKWYGVAVDRDSLFLGKYELLNRNEMKFYSFPVNDHLLTKLDPILSERMKWFAKGFYTVTTFNSKIRIYNLQVDMQGVKDAEGYLAPTGFYFEVDPSGADFHRFRSGVHKDPG